MAIMWQNKPYIVLNLTNLFFIKKNFFCKMSTIKCPMVKKVNKDVKLGAMDGHFRF